MDVLGRKWNIRSERCKLDMSTHVFFHEGENIRLHPALVYTAENPCGRQASKGMQFSLPCMYVYIVAVSKAACCENGWIQNVFRLEIDFHVL